MKILIYLIQVSACTGIFYLFYHLVLRRLTFFTINRWYLLSTLVLSFAIPLITIPAESIPQSYSLSATSFSTITEIYVPVSPAKIALPVTAVAAPYDWMGLLLLLYFLVAGILTAYLLVSFGILYRGLKVEIIARLGKVKVMKANKHFRNSSFLNYIFINEEELSAAEMNQIISHELIHVEQMHSVDKIVVRIAQIVLWFNPFIHAYANAVDANHEYEVDNKVSVNADKEAYVNLLLRLADPGNWLIGHQFSKFPLSRRIAMLFIKPSKNAKKLIYLLVLPLIVISSLVFANRGLNNRSVKKTSKIAVRDTTHDINSAIVNRELKSKSIEKLSKIAVRNTTNDISSKVLNDQSTRPKSSWQIDSTSRQKTQDMEKYLKDTREMVKQGKYKEGLERYNWFYQHALESAPAMAGVRNSFMISDWKSLGDVYPPAMAALRETRDQKTRQVAGREGDLSNLFRDVIALNRTLGNNPGTIALFQTVARSSPDDAKKLWIYVDGVMFAAKRYDIIRTYGRDPLSEFAVVKAHYDKLTEASNNPRMAAAVSTLKILAKNNFTEESLQVIQYALFVKNIKAAKEIQQKAMAVAEDYRLRDGIPADKKN